MNLVWISEQDRLPIIAQKVLLLVPRQSGGWWDPRLAQILVRHEGVLPHPVRKGDKWPVDFHWSYGSNNQGISLVTGNAYWASLEGINLPPGAEHYADKHTSAIRQTDGFEYVMPKAPSQTEQD